MLDIWKEVSAVYLQPSSIKFRKSFCTCRCAECEKMPIIQHSLPCGCKFCDKCLEHKAANSISIECPIHNMRVHLNKVKSIELKAEDILKMEAYCKNRVNGCNHVSIVKDLKYHEEVECCYSYTNCPLKCGISILRKDFIEHFSLYCSKRSVKCPHCNTDILFCSRESHYKTCSMFPVKCSFCNIDTTRIQLPQHEETCGEKPVSCKFREMGCKFRDRRISVSQHESLENHTSLFLYAFIELNELKNEAERQRDSLNEEAQTLREKIELIKEEQDSSRQGTEDSLEELKKMKEWMAEMAQKLETELKSPQGRVSIRRDHGIVFSPSSARFLSSARLDFGRAGYTSTPKSKKALFPKYKYIQSRKDAETQTQTDNLSRYAETVCEEGTQTSEIDKQPVDEEETNVKQITEESTNELNQESANTTTSCFNGELQSRRRKNSTNHCHPISPSTELIYPTSTTRITILACIALAVLLSVAISCSFLF